MVFALSLCFHPLERPFLVPSTNHTNSNITEKMFPPMPASKYSMSLERICKDTASSLYVALVAAGLLSVSKGELLKKRPSWRLHFFDAKFLRGHEIREVFGADL